MTSFRKILLTVVALAAITAGATAILHNNGAASDTANGYRAGYESVAHVPMAQVDNEGFLNALSEAGAESARIKSMAATRTPTPTPTNEPVCTRLIATYRGKELVVGEEVDRQDIEVRGLFYNGHTYTTETVTKYEILNPVIYDVGENEITVWYEGLDATFKVRGKEPLEIVSITARYKGGAIIVSNKINKNDVEVYAHYNWTDKSPDKITNFTLEPDTIEAVGNNKIYVHYGDLDPVTINVTGLEKKITAVEVKYLGGVVYVGDYVDESDFEVIVTYNDGSEGTADNFTITGQSINAVGPNNVIVSYKGYNRVVEVQGVERPTAIWDDFPAYSHGNASTFVTLIVSREKRAQSIEIGYVDWKDIDACVNRVFHTNNYLGFEVTYTDPDAIFEFPMPCRVRVPDDFNSENFAVFYSPNKKTITARVSGEFMGGNRFFAFTMEEPGTYIMVDMATGRLVSSINVKETNLRLRPNRNYSIDPVVLPDTAGNKEVTYYSTDESVATVSDKGKIKTLEPGECDIYIQATDESGVYEVIHLTVTKK